MQCCQAHWDQLREAMDKRGLSALVAKTGEDAKDSLERQIQGRTTPSDFDPLMNAMWSIFSVFLKDVGLPGLAFPGCPLCEVDKAGQALSSDWIEGSADDQLKAARTLGLAPKLQ